MLHFKAHCLGLVGSLKQCVCSSSGSALQRTFLNLLTLGENLHKKFDIQKYFVLENCVEFNVIYSFNIISFAGDIDVWETNEMLPVNNQSKKSAINYVNNINAGGCKYYFNINLNLFEKSFRYRPIH